MVILPSGDRALLVEFSSAEEVRRFHTVFTSALPAGVVDVVPAARTVLVTVDEATLSLGRLRDLILSAPLAAVSESVSSGEVLIDVVYDGFDLEEVARSVGETRANLVAAHTSAVWHVAFTGFAPGFAYLTSADWVYDISRRSEPRTKVPAGSVALAGEYCGAYPRDTPGGWQLIGATDAPLFDVNRTPLALLTPGMTVRFREVSS